MLSAGLQVLYCTLYLGNLLTCRKLVIPTGRARTSLVTPSGFVGSRHDPYVLEHRGGSLRSARTHLRRQRYLASINKATEDVSLRRRPRGFPRDRGQPPRLHRSEDDEGDSWLVARVRVRIRRCRLERRLGARTRRGVLPSLVPSSALGPRLRRGVSELARDVRTTRP